jgi:hypothetical protein
MLRVVIYKLIFFSIFITQFSFAGPPYDTDDPEPVELYHWEFYLSSRPIHDDAGWSGTLPHVELNYGAVKNLQLHVIAPMCFNFSQQGKKYYGYGDTELGLKYKLIKEGEVMPMIGTFPLIELPTGNESEELGTGKTQIYLPIWIQKGFGDWLTYAGGGYWINPGTDKRNWWFTGWLVQRQFTKNLSIGAEIYHTTPQDIESGSETRFNVGLVLDFTDNHHLLISAGKDIRGSVKSQFYAGYQFTFSPL